MEIKQSTNNLDWIILLLVTVSVLCPIVAISISKQSDEEQCGKCHEDEYFHVLSNRYVHDPYRKRKCRECHVMETDRALVSKQTQENGKKAPGIGQVRFIADSTNFVADQMFSLSKEQLAEEMVVEIRTDDKSYQHTILPAAVDVWPLESRDNTPLKIVDVTTTSVKKGLSISATIRVQTSKLATLTVLYGLNESLEKISWPMNYYRQHEISLAGLKADKQYKVMIVAKDLFGNSTQAHLLYFSTKKPFTLRRDSHPLDGSGRQKPDLDWKLSRYGGRFLFYFHADQPVALSLGIPLTAKPLSRSDNFTKEQKFKEKHIVLKDKIETTFSGCIRCHEGFEGVRSHPVNIRPTMPIPDDYPLTDGHISCNTCHANHGSNFDFRMIKSSKRELCIGCHTDMA